MTWSTSCFFISYPLGTVKASTTTARFKDVVNFELVPIYWIKSFVAPIMSNEVTCVVQYSDCLYCSDERALPLIAEGMYTKF